MACKWAAAGGESELATQLKLLKKINIAIRRSQRGEIADFGLFGVRENTSQS